MSELSFKTGLDGFYNELRKKDCTYRITSIYKDNEKRQIILKHENLPFAIRKGVLKNEYETMNSKDYKLVPPFTDDINIVKALCYVKIKDYNKSKEVFGLKRVKKEMFDSNQLFDFYEIYLNYTCKHDNVRRDIVEVYSPDGRKIKFLIEDLEFMYPDIKTVIKGYTKPKDRVIKKGSNVRIIKKNKQMIPKNTTAIVEQLVNTGNKKYALILFGNNAQTVIERKKIRVI